MKWRRISEKEAEMAIASADKIENAEKDRLNAYKTIGDKMLKVTYQKTGNRVQIITALWKGE